MFDNFSSDEFMTKILLHLSAQVLSNVKLTPIAKKNIAVGLEQMTSAIKFVTLPFALAGHTAEAIEEKYKKFLQNTFRKVPEEKLLSPDPTISIPVIQNIIRVFDKDDIKEIYSNLLASASNIDKRVNVHPYFPLMISQLSSLEVLILESFKKNPLLPFMEVQSKFNDETALPLPIVEHFCLVDGYEDDYFNVSSSLTILVNLGLIQKVSGFVKMTDENPYEKIYNSKTFESIRTIFKTLEQEKLTLKNNNSIQLIYGSFKLTNLGNKFLSVCY